MEPYWRDLQREQHEPEWETFSWLSLRALFSSVNDILAKGASAFVDDTRQRWVASQRAAGVEARFPGLVVNQVLAEPSFLVLGDPGEADDSQYAVVKPLLAQTGTDFMVICSDVVYPAGDVNDYVNAFYVPYREYAKPIYALPGNHDWYDGLSGFMYHFCASDPLPDVSHNRASYRGREWLARRLWRKAHAPRRQLIATYRRRTARPVTTFREATQPGPYFAIDTGPLLLVAIDTGVTGDLDREQGDWLRQISKQGKPKILLTGKPIHVDNKTAPGLIEDNPRHPEQLRYVDEIVRDADNRYVATIGGDVHNYQRYESTDSNGRRLVSIVCGGGGAYLSNTHRIPFAMKDDPGTRLTRCYPSRAQSIQVYARRLVPALWRLLIVVLVLALVGLSTAGALLSFWRSPHWIAVSALALAAVIGTFFAPERPRTQGTPTRSPPDPPLRWLATAALTGAAVACAAAWLLEGRLLWAALLWLGVVVLVSAVAAIDNRSEGATKWWVAGAVFGGGGVLASTIALAVAEDAGLQFLGAVLMLVVLLLPLYVHVGFGLFRRRPQKVPSTLSGLPDRAAKRPPQHPYRWALTYLSAPVALILAIALAIWQPRSAGVLALIALTLVYVVALPIVAFLARRRSRETATLYVCVAALVGPAAVGGAMLWLDDRIVVAVPVATLATLTAAATAAACGYLVWLRAIPLLLPWHSGDRNGEISLADATAYLRWSHQGTLPKDIIRARDVPSIASLPPLTSRAKRIVRMVTPPGVGRSILHRSVSEIFEPTSPPFYKSFVRVDASATCLRISAIGVTGESDATQGELIDCVEIPLSGR